MDVSRLVALGFCPALKVRVNHRRHAGRAFYLILFVRMFLVLFFVPGPGLIRRLVLLRGCLGMFVAGAAGLSLLLLLSCSVRRLRLLRLVHLVL